MQNKFAILIHSGQQGFCLAHRLFKGELPERLTDWYSRIALPRKASEIHGLSSPHGNTEGLVLSISFSPEQAGRLPAHDVAKKIFSAGKMAQKMGARMIDLGPLRLSSSQIGVALARSLKLAVTSGQSFILASALEGSMKALGAMGKNLAQAEVVVFDASASSGAACAQILAGDGANNLTMVSSDSYALDLLAGRIFFTYGVVCRVTSQLQRALRRADLLFLSGAKSELPLDLKEIKPGALICDLGGLTKTADTFIRDDIFFMEESMIKLPGEVGFSRNLCVPHRCLPASMAEAMILAAAGRFESFTLGREIHLNKVIEIRKLAAKHGFETVLPRPPKISAATGKYLL